MLLALLDRLESLMIWGGVLSIFVGVIALWILSRRTRARNWEILEEVAEQFGLEFHDADDYKDASFSGTWTEQRPVEVAFSVSARKASRIRRRNRKQRRKRHDPIVPTPDTIEIQSEIGLPWSCLSTLRTISADRRQKLEQSQDTDVILPPEGNFALWMDFSRPIESIRAPDEALAVFERLSTGDRRFRIEEGQFTHHSPIRFSSLAPIAAPSLVKPIEDTLDGIDTLHSRGFELLITDPDLDAAGRIGFQRPDPQESAFIVKARLKPPEGLDNSLVVTSTDSGEPSDSKSFDDLFDVESPDETTEGASILADEVRAKLVALAQSTQHAGFEDGFLVASDRVDEDTTETEHLVVTDTIDADDLWAVADRLLDDLCEIASLLANLSSDDDPAAEKSSDHIGHRVPDQWE